ncbi:XRE family transcriptional regulator [Streptomyces spectabilis]|uniref:XRE family transcriptional regulator n=1 Tax=Streptomyces spectabilis TaxID=68270 RepID=A0A5P2XBE8_STRST|nr:XRE family transcriptional regulator [Streptomyces spectabilis]MBB5103244.1 hypothetical protein [Streptomyces spectabilis]MCI3902436.1 hypothetical protein [Streptomyces spectabilis]QEV59782.1 XRE family transcriptional regulator [Streptomyces spectabilis]
MSGQGGDTVSREATKKLGTQLKELYQAVRTDHRNVTYVMLAERFGISRSAVGAWMTGRYPPDGELVTKYLAVVAYLESKSPDKPLPPGVWRRAIKKAQDEGVRNQGKRPPRSGPPAVRPFRYPHTAPQRVARDLIGRDAELDALAELSRRGPSYSALYGPPWAGKTALLAAFVTGHVPSEVDVISYFVQWSSSTNEAQKFLQTMVAQLDLLVGNKRSVPGDEASLFALYEQAVQTSSERGRSLLLVVDGLDEDAAAQPGQQSIASLLPKRPPPGLRVLVSSRWHPPLPANLDGDHPLQSAAIIPGFRPSPIGHSLRGAASEDLRALLECPDGREVIGLLALARGGLSYRSLIELMELGERAKPPAPVDLERMLRNVAGRGVAPEDLEPDTYVLAHEELYRTATQLLEGRTTTDLTQRLHHWADDYRNKQWPPTTPLYLLNGYPELLRGTGDTARFTTFALDHRRLLRLADHARTDLALASLDHVTRMSQGLDALASAAASRFFLERERRPVPRDVLRALARAGDTAWARSLALSPRDPASKATRLIAVTQALVETARPGATDIAREAANWAQRARYQDALLAPAEEPDTEGIVAQVTVVLASAGAPDEAIRLLDTIDVCSPGNFASTSDAAGRLLDSHPAFATRLLDELCDEADHLAYEADEGSAVAVEMWAAVAAADPGRTDPVHHRMAEFGRWLDVTSAGLAAVDCPAQAASVLAKTRPDDARALVDAALRRMDGLLNAPAGDRARETLARLVRALLDVDGKPDRARALLDGAPPEATARARMTLADEPDEPNELLARMRHLADIGDGPRARLVLAQATRQAGGTAAGANPIPWLPLLAGALAHHGTPWLTEAHTLLARASDPCLSLPVRILTSASLAHADAGRSGQALRYAEEAEDVVGDVDFTDPRAPLVRGLVAQAFAHAGQAQQAARWSAPDAGRRSGRARRHDRRVALAVEVGLAPEAIVPGVERPGLKSGYCTRLAHAVLRIAAGKRAEADLVALEDEARARGATEPLLSTGLALLHTVLGAPDRALRAAARLTDPVERATALTTVAAHLAGVPAHLDVAATTGDAWAISLLRVLARQAVPGHAGDDTTVRDVLRDVLSTSGWYEALPVLARTAPEAVSAVADVLAQHRQARQGEP